MKDQRLNNSPREVMEVYTGEGSLGESSSSQGSRLASPWMTLSRTLQYIAGMRVCLSVKLGMKRGSVRIFEDGGQDKSSAPSKLDLRAGNWGEECRWGPHLFW